MGCDYSTNLKDVIVKEGRLFKFCKIIIQAAGTKSNTKKRMNLIETEVGGHKTVVMVWEKEVSENKNDPHFMKLFYAEADAIVLDIHPWVGLGERELTEAKHEIENIQHLYLKGKSIPIFSSMRHQLISGEVDPFANEKTLIFRFASANGWKNMVSYQGEIEDSRYMLIADEIHKLGVVPRRLNPGSIGWANTERSTYGYEAENHAHGSFSEPSPPKLK